MKSWLELLRLPNIATAAADVTMGFLITHGSLQPASHFALLVAASCLLYLSGIVLNDVFDADVDARERPDRPIPSGRIPLRSAIAVGWALLASGVLVAWFASFVARDTSPGIIATLLAACIVLYNRMLKSTPFAPLVMGACRMLNVFLGMSLLPGLAKPGYLLPPFSEHERLIALGIGIYVTGVTWFARTDARISSRAGLTGGTVVLLAGIALLAAVPVLTDYRPQLLVASGGWYLLWAALALITARRCALAVYDPVPDRVQAAVRHCVHSLIVLDAAVTAGYASPLWGFLVLAYLLPTVLLTLWLRAT